jgi:monoamine oxidase
LNTFDADVIIIGAGVSGLAAAREFKEKGVSYLVVEGGNRVGGRMCSMQWQGTTIELGANWVTGCVSSNPIYRIAVEQLGLEGSVDERETD